MSSSSRRNFGQEVAKPTSLKKEEYWRQVDEAQVDSPQAFILIQKEYWRQVQLSEGFDLEGIVVPHNSNGLCPFDCRNGFRYSYLVDLYAKLGLHRYNLLEGTNLGPFRLIKFNSSGNCISSYFITLVACDPVTDLEQTFQIKVDENTFGRLDLTVCVARPKGSSTTEPCTVRVREYIAPHGLLNDGLCKWPSEDAFNDRRRFYMFEESELQDTDWIRLYLELVLCSKDRRIDDRDLSKLKIVKAAIETSNEDVEPQNKRLKAESSEDVEPPNERLKAKNAIVYITFRLASHGISEHVERRAIVRRFFDERKRRLILVDALTPFYEDTGFIKNLFDNPVTPEMLAEVRSRWPRP